MLRGKYLRSCQGRYVAHAVAPRLDRIEVFWEEQGERHPGLFTIELDGHVAGGEHLIHSRFQFNQRPYTITAVLLAIMIPHPISSSITHGLDRHITSLWFSLRP